MNLRCASVGVVLVSSFALACGSDNSTGPATTLTLSATQATVLMNKIIQIAPLHTDIAWLADSANLVLRSGAQADLIPLSMTTGAGPFYAVGLQRRVQLTGTAFSTFDLIAFNDPSNPTDFLIVDGFNSGATPPTSTTGSFDGAVNGFLFHIDGSTISAWRAVLGSGTLTSGAPGSACAGFQSSAGVTCAQASLSATFTITGAFQDAGPTSNTVAQASLASAMVSGIVLGYVIP
jgi:hypothetical protein